MKKSQYCFLVFIIGISVFILAYKLITNITEEYAISNLYETLGNLPVSNEIEEKINNISREIELTEKIIIRKMSPQALRIMGYHNAFCCYPNVLFGCITFNKPHIFISEGFFEDLLPEEQRFLIGHELMHIKQHHVLYLNLIILLIRITILAFWWFIIIKYAKKIILKFDIKYRDKIFYAFVVTSLFFCFFILKLLELSYRRYIEIDADIKSIELLKSHEGAIKLIERWVGEFKIPFKNNYYGLLSDHPSSSERKNYCLNLRKT